MKSTITQILVLFGLTLIAAAASVAFNPKAPDWYYDSGENDPWKVTVAEVEQRWAGDVFWIDARTLEEFEAGHMDGAVHFQSSDIQVGTEAGMIAMQAVMDASKARVVYCDGKACGKAKKLAQEIREDLGFGEAYFLYGGWDELKK